tara:strand:- start:478 stop:672 length:195 start_codon:yes stop_codon:yes gene_type:complete
MANNKTWASLKDNKYDALGFKALLEAEKYLRVNDKVNYDKCFAKAERLYLRGTELSELIEEGLA